jgi:hypothetical protein
MHWWDVHFGGDFGERVIVYVEDCNLSGELSNQSKE